MKLVRLGRDPAAVVICARCGREAPSDYDAPEHIAYVDAAALPTVAFYCRECAIALWPTPSKKEKPL